MYVQVNFQCQGLIWNWECSQKRRYHRAHKVIQKPFLCSGIIFSVAQRSLAGLLLILTKDELLNFSVSSEKTSLMIVKWKAHINRFQILEYNVEGHKIKNIMWKKKINWKMLIHSQVILIKLCHTDLKYIFILVTKSLKEKTEVAD